MAQTYTTDDGITLVNPGTYVSQQVKSGQGSIASAGVVTIIGEADEGPSFAEESDLSTVSFAPDSFDQVVSKYGTGRLVEAFKAMVAASSDPAIVGGVSLVRMVKTNTSVAASALITRSGFGTYATMSALREGAPGNLIRSQNTVAVAEQAPFIDQIDYVPHKNVTPLSFGVRANGGLLHSVTVAAATPGPAFVQAVESVAAGIMVQGGNEVLPLSALTGITLTASAPTTSTLQVSLPAASLFVGSPAIGDVVVIPLTSTFSAAQTSVIAGVGNANVGSYIITSISNTSSSAVMLLKRISSGTTISASGAIDADFRDLIVYKPIKIFNKTSQNRGSLVGLTGTFTCTTNDGTNVVLASPSTTVWAATPSVGDLLKVPSAFAGIAAGFYLITAASASTISATRLSMGTAGTASTTVVSSPIVAGSEPITFERKEIDGVGKSLEIVGDTTAFIFTPLGVAASISNSIRFSAAELEISTNIARGQVSNTVTAGGEIVMNIGCSSANATVSITDVSAAFAISGVTQFTVAFSSFKTNADFAAFVSSKAGFSAAVTLAQFAYRSPTELDTGVFGISAANGFMPAQIKRDAYDWFTTVNGSGMISIAAEAPAGLPEATSSTFLSGGAKGGTAGADVVAAIDACQDLTTNFVLPLFAVDASVDLVNGDTESTSTYTIAAINAYTKSHVLLMSQLEQRMNRVAIVAVQGIYSVCKNMASTMASARVGVTFQQVKNVNVSGVIQTFQPLDDCGDRGGYASCCRIQGNRQEIR